MVLSERRPMRACLVAGTTKSVNGRLIHAFDRAELFRSVRILILHDGKGSVGVGHAAFTSCARLSLVSSVTTLFTLDLICTAITSVTTPTQPYLCANAHPRNGQVQRQPPHQLAHLRNGV